MALSSIVSLRAEAQLRPRFAAPVPLRKDLGVTVARTAFPTEEGGEAKPTCLSRRWLAVGAAVSLGAAAGSSRGGGVRAATLRSTKVVEREPTPNGEAITLASGVQYVELREGTGAVPELGDEVVAHVRGFLAQRGDPVFMDTYAASRPLLFSMGTRPQWLTEGLEEAIVTMKAGSIRLVQVPSYLGFPEGLARFYVKPPITEPIPYSTVLRYEVELLRCNAPEAVDQSSEVKQRVCCSEPNYPCKPEAGSSNSVS